MSTSHASNDNMLPPDATSAENYRLTGKASYDKILKAEKLPPDATSAENQMVSSGDQTNQKKRSSNDGKGGSDAQRSPIVHSKL
jgi:hypothetical protein